MLNLLMPISRDWTREQVIAAIAASDIPRYRALLVFDGPDCGWHRWLCDFHRLGVAATGHFTGNMDPIPNDRIARRVRHNAMRESTVAVVPDGPLLILDDDTLVPRDVYARLSAAGPHATAIQVSRWGNDRCGVYRDGEALRSGHGVEPIDYCGHYCLLTTGEMYRKTALHTPEQCYMQPIEGLKADWDCVCGHLTEEGALWPR